MGEHYSVVIPAHNAAGTIERCLDSVFAQTLVPLELLLVDDYSGDNTLASAEHFVNCRSEKKFDVRYIKLDRNEGPSAARNRGIRAASGSYVAFLDADDIWCPEKLAIVDRFISTSRAGMIFHSYSDDLACCREASADHVQVSVSVLNLLWRNSAQTSCVVVKNKLETFFNESMRYCEDHDLWLRIAETMPVVRLLGDPLTVLGRPQLSPGGLSGNVVRMRLGEMRVFYNFCLRKRSRRLWLLPGLIVFSLMKHVYSWLRRTARRLEGI